MRLPKKDEIKELFHTYDPKARVCLFGSRVDDNKRGGDIDLLILSDKIEPSKKIELLLKLYEIVGEQKIDLIITDNLIDPFHRLAYKTGKLL